MTDFNSSEYLAYLNDQKNDTLGAGLGYKYLPRLVELLPHFNYDVARILDVGAGPFETWDWFMVNYDNEIIGVDIGNCVLDESAKWCDSKKASMLCPVDAHNLTNNIAPSSLDLVISFHAFEHMFDLPLVLTEINKSLATYGYLYFSLPIPAFNWKRGHWYDVPDVATMNQMTFDAGFRILHSELITDNRYRPQQEMICLAQK